MSEEEKNITDRLKQIFSDPVIAANVVDAVVHNKPKGWGRKSNAPYYQEQFGKQIKIDVDRMIETGNEIVWRYSKWCEAGGMSENTLYTRVNQSLRYLLEKLDPDRVYAAWHSKIRVERKPRLGVRISYIPGLGPNADNFVADEAEPKEFTPTWKREMEDWLESSDPKPFCKEGLALNPDEIKEIKVGLALLEGLMVSINSSSIKIIKMR